MEVSMDECAVVRVWVRWQTELGRGDYEAADWEEAPNYRAKNIETDEERVLAEGALQPWSDEATPLGKMKRAPPGG
jgi:hypothetical protein